MHTVDQNLLMRWTAAAERVGAQQDVRVEGERLVAAYRKPHRHYHDVNHLASVLDRLDVEDDVVAEVSRLVRLTATHDPSADDRDGHVLCDADLGVLGGTQDEYIGYAAAVRLEYAHIPDDTFAVARSAVLSGLLARPRIYRTPTARTSWEDAARTNISQELAFLASAGSGDAAPLP